MIFKILCVILCASIFALYRTTMSTGSSLLFDSFASVCGAYALVMLITGICGHIKYKEINDQ